MAKTVAVTLTNEEYSKFKFLKRKLRAKNENDLIKALLNLKKNAKEVEKW